MKSFSLVLLLVPAMIFCICMMFIFFFPEAFRLLQLRPHRIGRTATLEFVQSVESLWARLQPRRKWS